MDRFINSSLLLKRLSHKKEWRNNSSLTIWNQLYGNTIRYSIIRRILLTILSMSMIYRINPSFFSHTLSPCFLPSPLTYLDGNLTHRGEVSAWKTAVFSLPPSTSCLTLTLSMTRSSSQQSLQLIVGCVDRAMVECNEFSCDGYVGNNKASWGYKSSGQL